jgi:hypothetical protein
MVSFALFPKKMLLEFDKPLNKFLMENSLLSLAHCSLLIRITSSKTTYNYLLPFA